MPLPSPDLVDGLAFFTSPGYLADEAVVYKVFDLCAHHGFKLNGKLARNWTVNDIQRNIP